MLEHLLNTKTTEFWGKMLVQLLAAVLLILIWNGIFEPGDKTAVETLLLSLIGITESTYAVSRGMTKGLGTKGKSEYVVLEESKQFDLNKAVADKLKP